MIKQEFLKIIRRRGMIWSAWGVTIAIAIGITVYELIINGANPENYSGGRELLEVQHGFLILIGLVYSILIGAQAGSWDFANGTFRYMAMTGKPRLTLFAIRVPAVCAAVLAMFLPAAIIGLAGSLILPLEGNEAVDGQRALDFLWELTVTFFAYALLSLSIGALLRSSGAAIAVALVTNLIGLLILAAVASLNDTLGDLMLPAVLDRVSGGDSSVSIAVAAIALVVWIAAFLAVAAARTIRAEY